MTLERDFFPLKPLVHDRAFLLSLAGSVAAVIGIGFGVAAALLSTKIPIKPIADVSVVSAPTAHDVASAKPVSLISQVANKGDKQQVLAAWLTNWAVECKKAEASHLTSPTGSLVLVQAEGQFTAATSQTNLRTCDLVKRMRDNETIYTASDTPISPTSEKVFVTVYATR
jgi:hypothetical protein